jgi:hypothetical protein
MRSIAVICLIAVLHTASVLAQPAQPTLPDQAKAILDKAPTFELYSLEPDEDKKAADKPARLRGWKVLGKTTVKAPGEAGKDLRAALDKAIGKVEGAKCFDPRHAIHVEHQGKAVDILICFECHWVYVYLDGKKEAAAKLTIDRAFQPLFDKVLRDAKIPLAKKTQE